MYAFTFKRGGQSVTVPADTLHDATLLLPLHWRHGPLAGFSVACDPIVSDVDYYKARCSHLEHQLIELLRSHHGTPQIGQRRH